MIQKKDLTLLIKNLTGTGIPLELLKNQLFTSVNANTRWEYDLTGQVTENAYQVNIEVRVPGAADFQTLSAPLLDVSLQGVADALNTLNIGTWVVIGDMVVTWNDALVFGDMDILKQSNQPANVLVDFDGTAFRGPDGSYLLLTP